MKFTTFPFIFLFLIFLCFIGSNTLCFGQILQDTSLNSHPDWKTEIEQLKKDKARLENLHQLDISRRRERNTYMFIFISLLFLIFLLSFYRILQYRNKITRELEEKIKDRTLYLEKVIGKLARTNQEMDTFLYRTSHDLKGPLVTMEGLCNIALIEKDKSEVDEFLMMQKSIIDRMKLMLFRIIEIGQIRGHTIKPENINLKRYIKRIVKSMSRIEGYKQTQFFIDIPDNFSLSADLEMLDIALDNIINNAIIHNRNQYVEHYVRITTSEKNDTWEINISDNGLGIPEHVTDKVFSLFFRNTERTEGFGLGLYKAKTAIEKLSGQIQLLTSSGEKETTFTIIIPKNPTNALF